MDPSSLSSPTRLRLLVSFADIADFTGLARELRDEFALFELMSSCASVADGVVRAGGGCLVKWIGDAGLVVFDGDEASRGLRTLLEAKAAMEEHLAGRGHPHRVRVSATIGDCVAGPFGSARSFDVIGSTVNRAAMQAKNRFPGGFVASAELFRALDAETRKLLRRHREPDVYLDVGDRGSKQ